MLRDHPPPQKLPEGAGAFLSAALTIDRAASAIILYCLAESVSQIPKKDRRWLKFVDAVERGRPLDATLVIELASASDDLVARRARVTEAAIKQMHGLLSDLDSFEKCAGPMRQHLELRITRLKREARPRSAQN